MTLHFNTLAIHDVWASRDEGFSFCGDDVGATVLTNDRTAVTCVDCQRGVQERDALILVETLARMATSEEGARGGSARAVRRLDETIVTAREIVNRTGDNRIVNRDGRSG